MAVENEHALTLRLPQELHEKLKECAEREDRSIAGVLRMAARMYLSQPAAV
jgi:predicted DNA-binding protein